jgi:hypothetical protein
MPSPLPSALRRTLCCAFPGLLFVACSVDEERGLSYGVVSGGASIGSVAAGEAGMSGSANGGDGGAGTASGGAPDPGSAGASSGSSSVGNAGKPGTEGGAPSVPGSSNAGTSGSGVSTGGNAANGGTSGGGASGGVAAGGGSAGTGGKPDDGPCGDIDQNAVQDCQETVAKNAAFDANADDWLADPGVTKDWKPEDARGKTSGSVSVTFSTAAANPGWALAAVGQCLPAWGEQEFEVGARSFIPNGQSAGNAQLSLASFGEDDCKGSFLDSATPAMSAQTGSWQALHGSAKLPAGARSVLVRLAASKPGTQASLEVRFDDILFRRK